MPALLYGIGVFALFAGLVMIGFGVPINEFSFGNTLIGAGTTAAVGGLIIIGLGAVAGQLRRLAEAFATQSVGRSAPQRRSGRRPISMQTMWLTRRATACRLRTKTSPLRPHCAIPMSLRSLSMKTFLCRRGIR